MNKFDKAVALVLKHEGRFSDDPNDAGGATDYGISLRFLVTLPDGNHDGYLDGDFNRDGVVDIKDIHALTKEDAVELYREYFWNEGNFNRIVYDPLAIKMLDLSVTMGVKQGVKLLQRAKNKISPEHQLNADGILGNKTAEAINLSPSNTLYNEFLRQASQFYRNLAEIKPQNQKFLKGWLNRVNDI